MKKLLQRLSLFKSKKNTPGWKIAKVIFISCFFLFLVTVVLGFIGAGAVYFYFSKDLPDVRILKTYYPSTITQLYSDNDEKIAEFYIEKRIVVPMDRIPLQLKQAALAVEDSNFYYHYGIDPKAIFRAFLTNLSAGQVVEGGSTITQQLSKTLFLSRERTLERKIKEAILAIRMELIFTKDEILQMYLNQIYYGHGTYGVEAAARTYFGKHVQDLALEECAMIASLPKAPNYYSPYRNPDKAAKRRNHAIRRMALMGFITKEEAEAAMATGFNLGEVTTMMNRAPYFVEHIRQFLEDTYGSTKLYRAGLKVYTTLNMDYQEAAQQAVKDHILVADKRYGYRGPLGRFDLARSEEEIVQELRELNRFKEGEGPVKDTVIQGAVTGVTENEVTVRLGKEEGIIPLAEMDWARKPNIHVDGRWARIKRAGEALQAGDLILVRVLGPRKKESRWELALEQLPEVEAGLIALEPATGHIKAMVGGYEFSKSQFNRAMQAIRQPGSAFKPIIYASAIAAGYSPASIIIDSPIIFKEKDDAFEKWKPVNFEEKFYGPTSLRTAITHSRNIVTVKLLQNVGIARAVQMARGLGISTRLEKNLSIALGSSGVSLLEITSAYSTFANLGRRVSPSAVRYINDRNDEMLYVAEPRVTTPISSAVAYIITSLLQSVVNNGTGRAVKVLGRPVAGKTGTTNNYVDAWFIGYTPQLATGVWVGRDNVAPLGVNETGSRAAIPLWLQFMQDVHEGEPVLNFPVSDEITYIKVSPESGEPASFDDPDAVFEIFPDSHLAATADREETNTF